MRHPLGMQYTYKFICECIELFLALLVLKQVDKGQIMTFGYFLKKLWYRIGAEVKQLFLFL